MNENRSKRWRKILYEDQGVPDNYVDESFLDEMKKNCECNTNFVLFDCMLSFSEPRPLHHVFNVL